MIFASLLLKTDVPSWFILFCLLAGALYAFLLYSKKTPWSKNTNRALAALRFVLVTLLCFLLMGPLLNQVTFFEEKPVVVIAVDNSASVPATYEADKFEALTNQLSEVSKQIEDEGYEVKIKTLQDYTSSIAIIKYDQNATNLESILKGIASDYEQQNLAAVVLASDGIHNYGISPQFMQLNFPVLTIGLGDTIPSKDLSIKALNYNKIVYEGNRFPLVVEVFNNGFVNENVKVQVLKKGQVIKEKSFTLKGDEQINSVEFILNAESKGIETYQVQIVPQEGENSTLNNSQQAFLEVVDSKQKILIVARAPHPDIKALKNVVDKNEGTETEVFIEDINTEVPEGPFDLIVLHQLPSIKALPAWLDSWIKTTNTFYITGTSSLSAINERNPVLVFNNAGQTDNAGPHFNQNFELFKIDAILAQRLAEYPPISVPYGQFEFKSQADILLYQRIGSVPTQRPLLSIYNGDELKSAVFSGSDFWKWSLQEYALNNNQKMFESLMGKLIQYLATKDDKRNFRVNTEKNQYYDSEAIAFNTEVYNQLYEKIYDQNVDLTITNEQGNKEELNYVNSAGSNYKVTGLTPGVYRFEASATVSGKRETAQGTFSVQKLDLENINLTANHQLLKNIASNSGGKFIAENRMNDVADYFKDLAAKPLTRSDEKLQSIINNPWLLLLFLVLVSTEWFIRKYNGSY
ncbi:VWA domain-containing protein [Roseivirga echinicomitans]